MLLPCRFCTRMSLICPINSSRSNQSSQPCPAIYSRVKCCKDPGRITQKSSPREEEEEEKRLPQQAGGLSIVQPGGWEPWRAHRHTQEEINGTVSVHQPEITAVHCVWINRSYQQEKKNTSWDEQQRVGRWGAAAPGWYISEVGRV